MAIRATVLISGAEGSGKKTAIARAAEAVGVRAIPFSCQELRTGSDPKTAQTLKLGFAEAKHFAPALMILTDLESLVEKNPAGLALQIICLFAYISWLTDCPFTCTTVSPNIMIMDKTKRPCLVPELRYSSLILT